MPTLEEKIQEALSIVKRDLALLHSIHERKQAPKPTIVAMVDQVLDQLRKANAN